MWDRIRCWIKAEVCNKEEEEEEGVEENGEDADSEEEDVNEEENEAGGNQDEEEVQAKPEVRDAEETEEDKGESGSETEGSDFTVSEDKYFNKHRNEDISETQTTLEWNGEFNGEILTDEEETVTESWVTKEDREEEEEASTDDKETEPSVDEDGDFSDEDDIKTYFKDDYPIHVFLTLNEFRSSSVLTDLTLRTEDGMRFCVHSPVLAAVSSLTCDNLKRSKAGNKRADERKDDDTCVRVHPWSISLGPEVEHVGLEAIVEFAYTGQIPFLNKDNLDKIKAAAQTLGAPRVLDLCTEEEEKSTKTGGDKKRESICTAQQMTISLQSIKQLWMDRVGCDVTLEACGGSLHGE